MLVGHQRGRLHRLECDREPERGRRTDIADNDILGTGQKWRNLAARRLAEFAPAGDASACAQPYW